jgi:hypothetical protein
VQPDDVELAHDALDTLVVDQPPGLLRPIPGGFSDPFGEFGVRPHPAGPRLRAGNH